MRSKTLFLIYLLAILFISSSQAQHIDSLKPADILSMSLEDLLNVKINVSTTIPTDVFSSPSSVTVIDKELIDQYNFLTIAEALRNVAGVEILQTVIDKNVPTFRGILQNFYANKVLIMIDNIPVWHPTYGNSTLDRIGINDIERIEVLKGPASVLYGTNAYNGVINIIRKKAKTSELNARIDGGYPNLGGAAVNYSQQKNDLSFNISASSSHEIRNPYLIKGGYSPEPMAYVPDSNGVSQAITLYETDTTYYYTEQYRLSNFNANLGYKSHNIYFNTFVNSHSHPGVGATYRTGANQPITDNGTLFSYTFDKNLSENTHIWANAHYDYHFRDQYQSLSIPLAARLSSHRLNSTLKLNHTITSKLKIELGADVFTGHNIGHEIVSLSLDTVISVNIPYNKKLNEGSVFSQLNFKLKTFSFLGGIRYNYNPNYGGNFSSRITAAYSFRKNHTFKFTFGQSYRTPNLLELYFDHWSVVGNPNLKPEKNDTYEVVYMARSKYFFGQITAYHSYYTDLIQRIRTSNDESIPAQYHNVNKFAGEGIELETKYRNPDVINIFVNYNYMIGRGKGNETNFNYVPTHTTAMGVHKAIRNFSLATNFYSYSKTKGPWEEIPHQFLWDIHLGYKHKSIKGIVLKHTLSAKNITDSDMLIPEYIRKRPGVNTLATTGYGRRIIYTLKLSF